MDYKIQIDYVDSKNESDGLNNVIYLIGWTWKALDGDTVIGEVKGETGFPPPDPNSFIDLDDVDFDTMIGWIDSSIDLNELQSRIQQQS